jgi:hypothetical protein
LQAGQHVTPAECRRLRLGRTNIAPQGRRINPKHKRVRQPQRDQNQSRWQPPLPRQCDHHGKPGCRNDVTERAVIWHKFAQCHFRQF